MEEYKLFDAEYRLMELVWNLEPVNSTALARRCEAELGWKKSTVFNLIRKLAGRGVPPSWPPSCGRRNSLRRRPTSCGGCSTKARGGHD